MARPRTTYDLARLGELSLDELFVRVGLEALGVGAPASPSEPPRVRYGRAGGIGRQDGPTARGEPEQPRSMAAELPASSMPMRELADPLQSAEAVSTVASSDAFAPHDAMESEGPSDVVRERAPLLDAVMADVSLDRVGEATLGALRESAGDDEIDRRLARRAMALAESAAGDDVLVDRASWAVEGATPWDAVEGIGYRSLHERIERLLAGHGIKAPTAAAALHHFPNRQALLAAIAARGFRAQANALAAVRRRVDAGEATWLVEYGLAYVAWAMARPALWLCMYHPSHAAPLAALQEGRGRVTRAGRPRERGDRVAEVNEGLFVAKVALQVQVAGAVGEWVGRFGGARRGDGERVRETFVAVVDGLAWQRVLEPVGGREWMLARGAGVVRAVLAP